MACSLEEAAAAAYQDGRSAAQRLVRVKLAPDALELRDGETGDLTVVWPYASLRATGEPRPGELRLTVEGGGEERLVLRDLGQIAAVGERCLNLRGRKPGLRRWWPVAAALAAGLALLLVIIGLPTLAGRLMPRTVAERIGDAVLPEIAAQACVAGPGIRALDRLARPLLDAARAEGALSTPPRILVIDLAEVNGHALPGGRVLLTRGLVEAAHGPDEVAGVLAHELGHVIEAHPEQGVVRGLGVSGLARLAALGGADLSTAALDAGAGLTALASSRGMERQADAWGLRLMERASVSPAGLAGLMRRLTDSSRGSPGFALLATHPAPEERLAQLAAAPVPETPLQLLDAREWQDLRAICSRREPVADAVKAGR